MLLIYCFRSTANLRTSISPLESNCLRCSSILRIIPLVLYSQIFSPAVPAVSTHGSCLSFQLVFLIQSKSTQPAHSFLHCRYSSNYTGMHLPRLIAVLYITIWHFIFSSIFINSEAVLCSLHVFLVHFLHQRFFLTLFVQYTKHLQSSRASVLFIPAYEARRGLGITSSFLTSM